MIADRIQVFALASNIIEDLDRRGQDSLWRSLPGGDARRAERVGELRPAGDIEFAEDFAQVVVDSAGTDETPGGDFPATRRTRRRCSKGVPTISSSRRIRWLSVG